MSLPAQFSKKIVWPSTDWPCWAADNSGSIQGVIVTSTSSVGVMSAKLRNVS